MPHRIGLAALTAIGLATAAPAADPLVRQPLMGMATSPVPQGLRVDGLLAGGMAARLGLRKGDILVSLNHMRVATAQAFADIFTTVPIGNTLRVTALRGGKDLSLSARQAPRPDESYANATVRYGEVDIGPTRMRDILVTPNGIADPPVLFYISGYSCGSIEATGPQSLYGTLAKAFVHAGIAFYRAEKPGVGDSRGGTHCRDQTLADEVETLRATYRHLIGLGFPADRIFLLGHSLGGIEAPLIVAGEAPPRGIVPYGVMLKNWADYIQDITTFQDFATIGADPVEAYKQGERDRPILQAFFFGHQSFQQIVAANPAAADRLKALFFWDGGDHAYGRSQHLLQDLAGVDFPEAWAKVPTNVLSLYGATDEIALTSEDQRRIADIVDYYRPGTARFVEVPDTMHFMDLVGDRDAFRERNIAAGGQVVPGPHNPQVERQIIAWIGECLARPPVRTMTSPESLAERVKKANAAAH
jgi:Serine aminopeptidase, S33